MSYLQRLRHCPLHLTMLVLAVIFQVQAFEALPFLYTKYGWVGSLAAWLLTVAVNAVFYRQLRAENLILEGRL